MTHPSPPEPHLAIVSVRSNHPGRCLAFYQLLGLQFEPAPEADSPSFFHAPLAGARFEIHPASARRPAHPGPSLGFCFASVDAIAQALLSEGFRVSPAPPGSSPGAQALAFDPDGRPVELFPIDPLAPSCPPPAPRDPAFEPMAEAEREELARAAEKEAADILSKAASHAPARAQARQRENSLRS